jgi:nucleoside recognition membrane protein YjiH
MPGAGAIFIGKMAEALPVTLIVFAVAYSAAKKKKGLKNSAARVSGLALCTFMITGCVFSFFYDAINTGAGMAAEPGMQGIFELPAQSFIAAMASLLVIGTIGKSPEK